MTGRTVLGFLRSPYFQLARPSSVYKKSELIMKNESIPEMIAKSLDCNLKVAQAFYNENAELFETDCFEKISTLETMRSSGICPTFLMRNSSLLSMPQSDLKKRLSMLKMFPEKKSEDKLLAIVRMAPQDFFLLNKLLATDRKKIQGLSLLFKCSLGEAAEMLLKYKFLLRSKISTLQEKTELLLKGGFSIEELKSDVWVLTYTSAKLKERIDLIHAKNLFPAKTWMLRCKEDVLQRTINLRKENRLAMAPSTNSVGYICKRLNIAEFQVYAFAARHPPVMRVQVVKLKEMIDYLFSEGFTETQIYMTPRILCHSLSTIQNRLNLLKDKNYKLYTLSILCKSNKDFQDLLNKIEGTKMA